MPGSYPFPREAFAADLEAIFAGNDAAVVTSLHAVGDLVMYAIVARVRRDDQTIGYVVRLRALSNSGSLIRNLIGSGGRFLLTNSRGDLWTDMNGLVAARPAEVPPFSSVVSYSSPGAETVMAAAAPVEDSPWAVVVEMPLDRVLSGPREVAGVMLLFGLLLLGTGAVAAWLLTGRMTGSIVQLGEAAKAITKGDLAYRATVSGSDEVATVADAFNLMADSVAAGRRHLENKVAQLAVSEAKNRETRERMEHVITSSRVMIYHVRMHDGEPTLDWISDSVSRELGYDVAEALKPGWWQGILHPGDRDQRQIWRDQIQRAGRITREFRVRHANGEYRWVRDEQRILRDADGVAVEIAGAMADVSEYRELQTAKEAAEAANLAKNEFLSRMSHELRTPLNAILGFGQLMRAEAKSPDQEENVEQVLKAGNHLLALINEVLDISRIDAGHIGFAVEPVSLSSVLRESAGLVRLMAADDSIALHMREALATERFVYADAQRLKQVVLNLLSNAIKYNRPEGTVTVSCEEVSNCRVRVTVADTGVGIPPEKLPRLFTPFDRLGADRTRVEGTGLGLALSKGLVDGMGGCLGVESTTVGTRFWIDLPAAPPPTCSKDVAEIEPADILADAMTPTASVLFIEDNPANVRLMERIFKLRSQVALLTAMQGNHGLQLAREHVPNLVLLDVNLPDVSGEQVLRELKGNPALVTVPVVVISGDATQAQVTRMLDLGADGYITKPINVHAILRLVDDHLALLVTDPTEVGCI